MKSVSERVKQLDERVRAVDADFEAQMLLIPNVPDASVPVGAAEAAARIERHWANRRSLTLNRRTTLTSGAAGHSGF